MSLSPATRLGPYYEAQSRRGAEDSARGFTLAPPEKLFTGRYSFGGGLTIANYAVTQDGNHFLMIKDQPRAISMSC